MVLAGCASEGLSEASLQCPVVGILVGYSVHPSISVPAIVVPQVMPAVWCPICPPFTLLHRGSTMPGT